MINIIVSKRSKQVILDVPKLVNKYPERIKKALHDIGEEVKREDRKLIKSKKKTGRIYKFRGRDHRASAPGEAPANMTGDLQKGINYRVRNEQEMNIGEKSDYAVFLEKGTRKMKPRPHLITAINNMAGVTYNILEQAGKDI